MADVSNATRPARERVVLDQKSNQELADQVRHKPTCTVTVQTFRFKNQKNCIIRIAKTKALICVFGFAYEFILFSHDAAKR